MSIEKIKRSKLGQKIIYIYNECFEEMALFAIPLILFIILLICSSITDKDYITIKKLNNSYIVYDTETKLMYKIVKEKYMVQLWDYDEEGHPIAKYYEEDKEREE